MENIRCNGIITQIGFWHSVYVAWRWVMIYNDDFVRNWSIANAQVNDETIYAELNVFYIQTTIWQVRQAAGELP